MLHLPWTTSTPWNKTECILPWNSGVQIILSAVLHGWLAVVMHFEPILSVRRWGKCGKCIYIICVIIYDAFTCEFFFVLRNTSQATWYCVFVTSLVFQYLCLRWLCAFRDYCFLNFMQKVYLSLRRVMSHVFICTIAVYSKRESIFLRRRCILLGILITLSSQL